MFFSESSKTNNSDKELLDLLEKVKDLKNMQEKIDIMHKIVSLLFDKDIYQLVFYQLRNETEKFRSLLDSKAYDNDYILKIKILMCVNDFELPKEFVDFVQYLTDFINKDDKLANIYRSEGSITRVNNL